MSLSLPRSINIRFATFSDTPGVENLVSTLMLSKSILEDLKQYNKAHRDPVSTCYDQTGFLFLTPWDRYDPCRFNSEVSLDLTWRITCWEVAVVGLEDGSKRRKTRELRFKEVRLFSSLGARRGWSDNLNPYHEDGKFGLDPNKCHETR